MLTKKRLIFILSCFMLIMINPIDSKASEEYEYGNEFYNSDEYEEVKEAVLGETILYDNGVIDNTPQTRSSTNDPFTSAFKMYRLKNPDLIESLQNTSDIESLLSDEYSWILTTESNEAIKVSEVDGEWTMLGYSTPSNDADVEDDTIDVTDVEQILSSSKYSDSDGSIDVLCFSCPKYYTNFVYIKSDSTDSLIPYSARPDFTGLTNGQEYTVSEVRQAFIESFAESSDSSTSNSGAGYFTNNNGNSSIIIIILVLSATVLIFYYVSKRRDISK